MREARASLAANDGVSRRRFLQILAASVAAIETGPLTPAAAEDKFTIASTGGSWGDGLKASFVVASEFEKRYKVPVAYSQQLEPVAASKIVANCNNPVFSVSHHAQGEAVLLGDSGCVVGYNLDLVPNYRLIPSSLVLEQRPGIGPYYAPYSITSWGLAWNTKLATKPASFKELWNPEYKGRVGIPTYGWYGMYWLHAINKLFGGNEDDVAPGIQAVADLVKKNNAIIMENTDHGLKLFQREEIAIAPFWNSRAFSLQDSGVPIGFEYVQGSIAAGTGFVIVKGTAFPEVAQRFVNDTLDERYVVEMARRFKLAPTNPRAKLPADLERIRVTEKDLERHVSLDWRKINQHRSAYLERWNKEILGKA